MAQCALKLVERLVLNRLNWWMESEDLLPISQFGFRKGKSCLDNLAILHTHLHREFEHNKNIATLFLDIQGAYDNVNCDILLAKLKSLGLTRLLLSFIFNIIHSRSVHLKFDYLDMQRTTFKGLPQDSVLSLLLYSIYVSDLEQLVATCQNIQILQFADDACLFSAHQDPQQAVEDLERGAMCISEWLTFQVGLDLAPSKSVLCLFSKKPSVRKQQWSIWLQDSLIHSQHFARFLDLTFQDNLKWNKQIDALVTSCLKPLKVIGFLRTTWWGADPSLLLLLYRAFIRSRIDYGSFIWNQLPRYLSAKLDRVQYNALRVP